MNNRKGKVRVYRDAKLDPNQGLDESALAKNAAQSARTDVGSVRGHESKDLDPNARLQEVLQELGRWDPSHLRDLYTALTVLLGEAEVQPGADDGSALRRSRGSIEVKTIKGRQYRYLRYWQGKTRKSVYLGKVER